VRVCVCGEQLTHLCRHYCCRRGGYSMFHKMALGGKKRKKLNVSVHTLEAPERGGPGSDDE